MQLERAMESRANLFSSTSVVFAVHGAGLSNIIFCRPGTRIVEVQPKGYVPVPELHGQLSGSAMLRYAKTTSIRFSG